MPLSFGRTTFTEMLHVEHFGASEIVPRGALHETRVHGRRVGEEFWGEMVRPERFERPTYWFVASCSIQLSYGRT